MKTPCIIAILDGWGHGKPSPYNAITQAKTPVYDRLVQKYPMSLLSASGEDVGLPKGQMGNSEVGHLHIGAGRLVRQSLSAIDESIKNQSLHQHPLLTQLTTDHPVHLLGLVSPGGVHSHENHLLALIDILYQQGHRKLVIHAILDGRDTAPRSALTSIQRIESLLEAKECGSIGSICGRFYAMDRDQRWDRTQAAYDLYCKHQTSCHAATSQSAIEQAYAKNLSDEFIPPTLITGNQTSVIAADHPLILFNFRADRMRQLTSALTQAHFTGFDRGASALNQQTLCMCEYQSDLQLPVLFPKPTLKQTLGEVLSQHQYRQYRIAETEKFAHVTYFLNGGQEVSFPLEERILIPSDKIATYDLKPQMQAKAITESITTLIEENQADFIIANYANPDMVGHTGNFEATLEAITCIDQCLGQLESLCLKYGAQLWITADHGNAEVLFDPDNAQAHTAHTSNPVPFIAVGASLQLDEKGTLADIAPTLLASSGISIPKEMTGRSLIK